MINVDRLVALRNRFGELHADYQRRGADLRATAAQFALDRSSLLAQHPKLAGKVDTMTTDELKTAGVNLRLVVTLRATKSVIERKRRAHEHLGARVRLWSSYLQSVERLAAEHQA